MPISLHALKEARSLLPCHETAERSRKSTKSEGQTKRGRHAKNTSVNVPFLDLQNNYDGCSIFNDISLDRGRRGRADVQRNEGETGIRKKCCRERKKDEEVVRGKVFDALRFQYLTPLPTYRQLRHSRRYWWDVEGK